MQISPSNRSGEYRGRRKTSGPRRMRRVRWAAADRNAWWFAHMAGMLGSYVATVSAFSVVNFTFLPIAVRWLWPTVIGTPLIALWITYYKIRFRRAPSTRIEAAPAN